MTVPLFPYSPLSLAVFLSSRQIQYFPDMKYIIFSIAFSVIPTVLLSQIFSVPLAAYQSHEKYHESEITHRRFKHSDVEPLLLKLRENPLFQVTLLGKSIEGRTIYDVSFGDGKTTVLLWSQMHGDEPTATMAGLDLFNFFSQSDELDPLRQQILDKLNIHFIPMLNPDGAEQFQRHNAIDIDLNRDALRLQSPESQILKRVRDSLQADFGFNLHDQSIYYTAGVSPHPATISFLAPAYNYEKEVNQVRNQALQLIVLLNDAIQSFIPNQVGRYNDDFEPRAFGDNMQKWGTSTVLIESGGYKDDPEKQQIRKINFILLLTGLHAIAQQHYQKADTQDYFTIPENERRLYDLVIRNAKQEKKGQEFIVDLGVNRTEIDTEDHRKFYHVSRVQNIGDLSTYFGYQELDAEGLSIEPGKIYPKVQKDLQAVANLNTQRLLKRGYTTVQVRDLESDLPLRSTLLLNVVPKGATPQTTILLGQRGDFILRQRRRAKFSVVNGVIIEL
ncbi:MAG: M14 family zinc carboxypeptidase [Bacteroidota bacterium]